MCCFNMTCWHLLASHLLADLVDFCLCCVLLFGALQTAAQVKSDTGQLLLGYWSDLTSFRFIAARFSFQWDMTVPFLTL